MVRLTDSETSLTAGVQNQTQFVHVERERSGTQHRNGSIGGSTIKDPYSLDGGGEIVPLVDVATPKPIRTGRTKPYRVEANPVIEGTWVEYWMWLCRPNPHDTEPKPLPLIPTQK